MKNSIIAFLILVCISCNTSKTTGLRDDASPRWQRIGPDTLKILREAYIIDRNGAKLYSEDRQEMSACILFGEPVNVLVEKDSITGVAPFGEQENIYYINRKTIGSELEIPLNDNDLNLKFNPQEQDYQREKIGYDCSYHSEEEIFDPNEYPDVEVNLITLKEFEKMKKTAAEHLILNNAVKKKDSVITIGNIKFEDGLGEGNLPNTYNYMGEYRFLNAYLLRYTCEACEEYSYSLIDKISGKEIAMFSDIPYFSNDGTFALTLGQLFSDHPTELYITKWREQEPKHIHKEFGKWVPVGEGFWGKDNSFYAAVIPFMTSEDYNRHYEQRLKQKYNFRYIKIKIKGPTPLEYGE